MFSVYIWVPTKGWKFVRSFTADTVAFTVAQTFEPLEVKVTEQIVVGEKTLYQTEKK